MIEFFRDTISGWVYYVYIGVDLLFIFALIGYIIERKEKMPKYENNESQITPQFNEPIQSNTAFVQEVSDELPVVTSPVQAQDYNTNNLTTVVDDQNDTIKQ